MRTGCRVLALAMLVAGLGVTARLVPAWAAGAGGVAHAPDWQEQPLRLVMVEREGCYYCARWDAEIGPGFDKSPQGRRAPLMRVDIDGPWPDGIVLDAAPVLTPTFILLERGVEMGRIEGYVGAKYFYPVLDKMMQDAGVATKQVN